MSKKIIGITVGTPLSTNFIKEKLHPVTSVDGVAADENGNVNITGYATEQYVKEYAQPKGNYLTEHQDISGKLDADKLPEAIDEALANAKASGEFDGQDGYTPQKNVDYFDGADGKSAYEYAKDAGYDGTEEEFAEKLANGPDEDDFVPRTREDISVNGVTGLGIADNETIPAGTSLTDLVKMLVQRPIPATYTKPTISIANNNGTASGNIEAGSSITPKLKATFTQNDAGSLSTIVIKKGTSQVSSGTTSPLTYDGSSITIGDESISFTASATYGDAPVKNNNLGQESKENWFTGDTITSGAYTITGKRNMFYGTGAGAVPTINSNFVRGLSNTKLAPAQGNSVSISVAVGQQYVAFAYPATLRDVNNVTYVEANDTGMASSFTKTTINVADARSGSNGLKSYKVYTYAMAVPAAAAMTFKVTI